MGPSGDFVAKALMPKSGLTSGVADPSRLYFPKSKMPPNLIWFPQLVQRPYGCLRMPFPSVPGDSEADLLIHIFR